EVAPADVEHRAHGYERAEANIFAKAPIENRGAQRAALAEKGYASRMSSARCKGRIQPNKRVHDSQAIRPDQPHSTAARHRQDLLFQREPVGARLAKSSRNDYSVFHSRISAITDRVQYGCRGCRDHRQVYRYRDRGDARVCLTPKNAATVRINW